MTARAYNVASVTVGMAIAAVVGWPYVRRFTQAPLPAAAETVAEARHAAAPAAATPAPKVMSPRVVSKPTPSDAALEPVVRSDCSPSPTRLHKLTVDTLAAHPNPTEFARALDLAVGVDPDTPSLKRGVVVSYSEELSVLVMFPYATFRTSVLESLRKKEPIVEATEIPNGVIVGVTPSRIDAPDIEKVIVERDGQSVPPIASTLRPTEMVTRMGARQMIHAGLVVFPCSAFLPGAFVVITAIPAIGSNLVKVMQPEELRTLK